jgi:hypothetical protein
VAISANTVGIASISRTSASAANRHIALSPNSHRALPTMARALPSILNLPNRYRAADGNGATPTAFWVSVIW